MLPSERPSILLLCNPHTNDVSIPCINSSRCFYQVDQLFVIPRGLDLRGRHGGSSCAWCSSDISQAREGRWPLGFGDERETDVCRAGGCSGTLPTCANNLSAALCYSPRTVPENGQSRLVLLPAGRAPKRGGLESKSGSIPLCFQLSFLLHLGAFDGESGLWSSAQARDCLQPSQSTVCTRRLDGDGQPP